MALAGRAAAQTVPLVDNGPTSPLATAISQGTFSLDERLRWEYADQVNLRSSNAVTLRSLFGYTSGSLDGFKAMLEGENVASIGNPNNYNAAGTNAGGAGRTSIPEPTVTDLNQAWLSYSGFDSVVKLGRQRLTLDNQRFVGDVNWRQNQQTFDAATATVTPEKDLSVFYGYVWRVSRVYGNKSPQPDFSSETNLINVAYSGLPYGRLVGYAYLLGFRNSAANSSDTYGASFTGAYPFSKKVKLTYHAEMATQSDARNNPLPYTARYYIGELGVVAGPVDAGLADEVLGSDSGKKGFATPLATYHAFNGWVNLFTTTPAAGLKDAYGWVQVTLPGAVPVKFVYHKFESDYGDHDYGKEYDAMVTHKFDKRWSVLAEVGKYEASAAPYVTTTRFWLATEFMY